MITAAFLLAGVIIDVTLLHWAMITLTVIAITAAIRYHDVHVVMTTRGCHFDLVVVSTLSSRRRYNVVDSLRLSSGTSSTTTMTDVRRCRLSLSVVIVDSKSVILYEATRL